VNCGLPAGRDRRLQMRRLRSGAGGNVGIGQGDAAIVPHVDFSLYVMTPEFGAASQLEKIDMLDFGRFRLHQQIRSARSPGRAARRAQANAAQPPPFTVAADAMPVFGTSRPGSTTTA